MPKRLMNGIEAVALSAIEGGVEVFAGAESSPALGVLREAQRQSAKVGISSLEPVITLNSKAALNTAYMASVEGSRTLWACSCSEFYDATEALTTVRKAKIQGSLVIITCCDATSSANTKNSSASECDIRRFAQFAKMPLFDPADPKQAMAMVKAAINLSDEYEMPVVINLSEMVVGVSMFFEIDPSKLSQVPLRANYEDVYLKNASTDEKIHKIAHALSYDQNLTGFNRIYDRSPSNARGKEVPVTLGIACAGSSVPFAAQALASITQVAIERGIPLPAYRVLQVCTPYPYPKRAVFRFVNGLTNILVIEGPDPIIENGMLKDSATNFLAPKVKSVSAIYNISDVGVLARKIASFFDDCAGERVSSSFRPSRLEPCVKEFFQMSKIYECSLDLAPRNPGCFDNVANVAAFNSFVQALGELEIAPESVVALGIPCYMANDRLAGEVQGRLSRALPSIESSTFPERLAWLKMRLHHSDGMLGVAFASAKEVLDGALMTLADVAADKLDITIVVVDTIDDSAMFEMDIEGMLQSLGASVSYCDSPFDNEAAKAACKEALSAQGLSFAMLIGREGKQIGLLESAEHLVNMQQHQNMPVFPVQKKALRQQARPSTARPLQQMGQQHNQQLQARRPLRANQAQRAGMPGEHSQVPAMQAQQAQQGFSPAWQHGQNPRQYSAMHSNGVQSQQQAFMVQNSTSQQFQQAENNIAPDERNPSEQQTVKSGATGQLQPVEISLKNERPKKKVSSKTRNNDDELVLNVTSSFDTFDINKLGLDEEFTSSSDEPYLILESLEDGPTSSLKKKKPKEGPSSTKNAGKKRGNKKRQTV